MKKENILYLMRSTTSKTFYYVLILLLNDEMSETYSLLYTIWLAENMIITLHCFYYICYSKKSKYPLFILKNVIRTGTPKQAID